MNPEKFLLAYVFPFCITLIALWTNEWRLYQNKRISYMSFTNSIAMLIISLCGFMLIQVLLTTI